MQRDAFRSPVDTPLHQLLLKPNLPYKLFLFSLFSLKRQPSESMTKELIPHNVTIFPCIKEVTLRYWNQRCATWGFPFYLGEIKDSHGLPTNNHLAPSPHVIWSCLMKAKQSFYSTPTTPTLPSTTWKQLKICQHLQTFEESSSKRPWAERLELLWGAPLASTSFVAFVSLPACHCSQMRKILRLDPYLPTLLQLFNIFYIDLK